MFGDGERGAFAVVVGGRTAAGGPLIRRAFCEIEGCGFS
jgi:hypothetical protein